MTASRTIHRPRVDPCKAAVTQTEAPGRATAEHRALSVLTDPQRPPSVSAWVGLDDALFGSWWIGATVDDCDRAPCELIAYEATGDPQHLWAQGYQLRLRGSF